MKREKESDLVERREEMEGEGGGLVWEEFRRVCLMGREGGREEGGSEGWGTREGG